MEVEIKPKGTQGRIYGGCPDLVHIADGQRRAMGERIAIILDDLMRKAQDAPLNKPLCPGCAMIALFNAAITVARANGQSLIELGQTMGWAFLMLTARPEDGVTEEIKVILDPE